MTFDSENEQQVRDWCNFNIKGRYSISKNILKLDRGGYSTGCIIGFESTADLMKFRVCFKAKG